jgi:hypothetical protein
MKVHYTHQEMSIEERMAQFARDDLDTKPSITDQPSLELLH